MCTWGTSLIGEDETGSDPAAGGTEHQCRGNTLSVEETSGSNDLNRLARHWADLSFDELGNSWNEDGCWDISGVSTTFTTLCADDVDTECKTFGDVFWVSDHVHVENAGLVELVDNVLWWNTYGRNKEFRAGLDDNISKLIKLSLGVVVAVKSCVSILFHGFSET